MAAVLIPCRAAVAQASSLPVSHPAHQCHQSRTCRARHFPQIEMPTAMLSGFHSRGYLPHLETEGSTYFVTFRLAGTLPREVIASLKTRRDDLLRRAADEPETSGECRSARLFAWYAAEVDSLLDRTTDALWLRHPAVASLVAGALRHFEGRRYRLHAWVIMPSHVHAVVQPLGTESLGAILHSWKSFSGNGANRLLGRIGRPFWQKESYDHLIRHQFDLVHCCHYTEENPVKAGLCSRPEDWPWTSANPRRHH